MAVIGNSYAYHTRLDVTDNIQPGVAQQFGENTLAILTYLTKSGMTLDGIYKAHDRVYFSVFQKYFVVYSKQSAAFAARLLFTIVLGWIGYMSTSPSMLLKGLAINVLSLIAGLTVSNVVASLLTLLGLQMRWFTSEYLCLIRMDHNCFKLFPFTEKCSLYSDYDDRISVTTTVHAFRSSKCSPVSSPVICYVLSSSYRIQLLVLLPDLNNANFWDHRSFCWWPHLYFYDNRVDSSNFIWLRSVLVSLGNIRAAYWSTGC